MKTLIVYTSQSGFTQKYANMLADKVSGELLTLREAKSKKTDYYDNFDAIIYGGWVMAGRTVGSRWFLERAGSWREKKLVLFSVGASPEDNPDVAEFLQKQISEEQHKYIGTFYCQGGINYSRMKLPSRLAMKAFASSLGRNKAATSKEKMMAEMISHDYDISDEKYLRPILEYLEYLK